MQEDGPAWPACCPHYRQQARGRCDSRVVNASRAYPACNAKLDQHMYQDSVFAEVKARAAAAGRPPPHCMLYLNSALLFPFDIGSANRSLLFRDIHGRPHVEAADPAILTYFWGWSKPAVQQAWVDVIRRATHADGVYAVRHTVGDCRAHHVGLLHVCGVLKEATLCCGGRITSTVVLETPTRTAAASRWGLAANTTTRSVCSTIAA